MSPCSFPGRFVRLAFVVVCLLSRPCGAALLPPVFLPAPGFHPAPVSVTLSNPNPATVLRYTLNAATPVSSSPIYSGAVLVVSNRSGLSNGISMIPGTATLNQHTDGWLPPRGLIPKATLIRSRAFGTGTNASPAASATYFVGESPMARYGLPVVSLSLATNDLYNYSTGIYVLGKVFDDYVKAHPGEALTGHTPANYTQRGAAWERLGFMEWFEPDGTRAYTRPVLVDIQGQSSRSFRQKSLGLKTFADDQGVDTFRFPFFPGLTNRAGDSITRFDHLRLANSGNDWAYTLFRDALCHVLAQPTCIDTLAYRPVAVYLDGEFWGVHNLREQQDPDFIMDHYDVPQDEVVICQPPGVLLEGQAGDELAYSSLVSFLETHDLTQGTNYAHVNTLMDVENFIAYQAAEIYFGNADWPHNNIRVWRRRTLAFEPDAPFGHDGRWRWLLFDVDLGYGHPWSGGFGENSLSYAMDPNGRPGLNAPWSTVIFRRLLTHPGFRNQFINTLADGLNTLYRDTRATSTVARLQANLEPAMADHIQRWRTMADSTNGWRNEVKVLSLFASQRPIYVRQHMVTQFGLPGFANLTLDMLPRGAGEFQLNSIRINESTPGTSPTNLYPWRGTYFRGVPVSLQAVARPGYRFAGWNGRPELGTNASISAALLGTTNLTARFERTLPAHPLATGPFTLRAWPRLSPAGTWPATMLFEQTAHRDPGLDTPMTGEWRLPYNAVARSRILGMDGQGIGFLNTSDPQPGQGSGYAGSAVLALNAVGVTNIVVSWIGATPTPNEQSYSLRLQYAIGDGPYRDVPGEEGRPVEYVRNALAGHELVIGPVRLPSQADGQSYVRLRWKYFRSVEGKGTRPLLRLDDIRVAADSPAAPPLLDVPVIVDGIQLRLAFSGSVRTRYQLEISDDLRGWSPLDRPITDLDGRGVRFEDWLPSSRARFYRIVP